uniref:Uncharacterized protein n=1 Tax=Siphoviridae sp. ct96x5 TaxID=2825367 RepID=A0A8S5PTJ4_9CAUD|nr:MAG TPA: hypothetical protein [Siphoviridae sp. ct96x5]
MLIVVLYILYIAYNTKKYSDSSKYFKHFLSLQF